VDTYCISDCEGKLKTEIEGKFCLVTEDNKWKSCFTNSVSDATTIGELINCCGYTFDSVVGKRVKIYIEEID
jgi:hypothetical protein